MQLFCKLFGKASEAGDSVTRVVLSLSRTQVTLSLFAFSRIVTGVGLELMLLFCLAHTAA